MYTYFHNNYLYSFVEMQRFSLEPCRQAALKNKEFFDKYFSESKYGRTVSASFELFERITRDYQKPEFGIKETIIDGKEVKIKQETIVSNTFCKLLHFKKPSSYEQPKMLVVAPLSGHYATLLRGTVKGLLPYFDVYITDWVNARDVSVEEGFFTFDDFVRYVVSYIKKLGPGLNVMAVCQPSVPVSVAVSMLSKENHPCVPNSMTLMGGPIDTRKNPTEVNDYAADRTIRWFESNVVTKVPLNYKGAGRSVYPGFMQLYGFMAMNLQTHMEAHWDFFNHLIDGDGDSAESHKKFYNEYLSVMDMPAEFYLETVNLVFKKHLLPRGKLVIDGEKVNLADINKTALLCIEGEKDDISGRGQTKAAIDLCKGIPDSRKKYHLQKDVGHYGIFNGRRYREKIVPIIVDFVKKTTPKNSVATKASSTISVETKSTASKAPSTVVKPKKEVSLKKDSKKELKGSKKLASKAVVNVESENISLKKGSSIKSKADNNDKSKIKKSVNKSLPTKAASAPKSISSSNSSPAKKVEKPVNLVSKAEPSPKVVSIKKAVESKKSLKAVPSNDKAGDKKK